MTTTRRASAAAAAATAQVTAARASRASTRCVKPSEETIVEASKPTSNSAKAKRGRDSFAQPADVGLTGEAAVKAPSTRQRKSKADVEPASTLMSPMEAPTTGKRSRGGPRKSLVSGSPVVKETQVQPPTSCQADGEQADALTPPAKRVRKSAAKANAVDDSIAVAVVTAVSDQPCAPPAVQAPQAGRSQARVQIDIPVSCEPAAEEAHQLQLQVSASMPDTATDAPPPTPAPSPTKPPAELGSPQRRVLSVVNGAPPAMAASSPRRPAAAMNQTGSPKAVPLVKPSKQELGEQEIVQIRRLLMPGALACTLASCAVAAGGAASGVPSSASGDGADRAAEPAGRAAQYKELCNLVTECCSSGRGAAVYISGLPGTGKTYTVSRLLSSLPSLAAKAAKQPSGSSDVTFCCATINCMTLDDPAQLYSRLQSELIRTAAESGGPMELPDMPSTTDATVAHGNFLTTLQNLSFTGDGSAAKPGGKTATKGKGARRGRAGKSAADADADGPRRRVFVVVLDEVDRLLRRRDGGEELARLFQVPATPGLSMVLLAAANSLDLTERLMPLLRSRGLAPRHLVFTAYSRPQVLSILRAQLSAHPLGSRCFEDAALDMVAKSVSSSSGDLRQALKACRTALDVLLELNRNAAQGAARASVGIREVHAALQRIASTSNGQSAVIAKVKGLPPQQQLVLLALATAVGARAAAASAADGGAGSVGGGLFTGSRPKFADAVAFREIGNQAGGPTSNPGACFDGPTPAKGGRPGAAASTPTTSRVRGITGPGAAATPSSCGRGAAGGGGGGACPPSRTPASILAGDAGLALGLAEVYAQYGALCRQLNIPAMSESAFRTDALPGLDCDGLLRIAEGRTPAATRLSLRVMVRDVQAALADNVMFKRLMGAKAPGAGNSANETAVGEGVVRP